MAGGGRGCPARGGGWCRGGGGGWLSVGGGAGSGRGWWQRGESGEGGGQVIGPGPGSLEAQGGAARVEGEPAGEVQEPVAQGLGFADGERAVEAQQLGPGGEVLGDQGQLEPDLVVVEVAERQVLKPGLLSGADAVFGVGAGAVQALDLDGVAVRVGQGGPGAGAPGGGA